MLARKMLLGALLSATLVVGCGTPDGGTATGTTGTSNAGGKTITIGVVFDSGGRGDRSFNDSAWEGVSRAQADFGIRERHVESKTEKDYVANLEAMAEQGLDLVIAVGINMTSALKEVAPRHPNVKFAIIDGDVTADNVRALKFKEEEGSFLAGYLAGLTTETGKIGFVGGQEIPLIRKFQVGYEAGARMANPNVQVLPAKYTGDWNNVDVAKTAANVLYSQGADIVYHAAGRAGLGVIRAAQEQNKYAIGVDSDQDHLAEGNVLTSMVKRVDVAVHQTIKDVIEGNFTAGEKVYDLQADGVGLSEMRFTREKIGEERLGRLNQVRERIASGDLQIPARQEDLQPFLAAQR
jgi:basic membrane protein A and related proteins